MTLMKSFIRWHHILPFGNLVGIGLLSSTKISSHKTSPVAVLLLIFFYLKKPE
jgi:hypothetical protein